MIPKLPTTRKPPSIDDFPQDKLLHFGITIFILGALAWDYAETVADITSTSRMPDLKKQTRQLRQLRRDYLSLQKIDLDKEHFRKLEEHALEFEEMNMANLNKLALSVKNGFLRYNLPPDQLSLATAVAMAQTIVDAIMLYGNDCDIELGRHIGNYSFSIIPAPLRRLSKLLPEFLPVELPDTTAMKTVSRILVNKAHQIIYYDETGEF